MLLYTQKGLLHQKSGQKSDAEVNENFLASLEAFEAK